MPSTSVYQSTACHRSGSALNAVTVTEPSITPSAMSTGSTTSGTSSTAIGFGACDQEIATLRTVW